MRCEYAQSLCIFDRKKPEVHCDPHSLLRTPSCEIKNFCFGAKKDKYTCDFFCTIYICFEHIASMLLFGSILLLNLTNLLPCMIICHWRVYCLALLQQFGHFIFSIRLVVRYIVIGIEMLIPELELVLCFLKYIYCI